jgi:hypothetical protein
MTHYVPLLEFTQLLRLTMSKIYISQMECFISKIYKLFVFKFRLITV